VKAKILQAAAARLSAAFGAKDANAVNAATTS